MAARPAKGLLWLAAFFAAAGLAHADGWTNIGPVGLGGWIHALAIDPRSPSTVYVGYNFQGLWKTTDGGTTWSQTGLGLTNWQFGALAVAPSDPSKLYAATIGGIFRSMDAGATWQQTPGKGASAMAVDPLTATTAYTTSAESCVYYACAGTISKTVDGGTTWTTTSTVGIFTSLVILPWSPQVLFAIPSLTGFGPSLMESTDGGSTWAEVTTLSGSPTSAVAVSPGTPQTIYAGTLDGGVYRSGDSGASWQKAIGAGLAGLSIMALTADAQTPSTVYAAASTAAGSQRIFRSTNGGDNWTAVSNATGLTVLASSAMTHGPIWAATDGNGLFRSDLTGQSWALVSPNMPIPNLAVRQIVVDPKAPSTIYVLAGNGLYKTLDGGQTWTPLLLRTDLQAIALDPTNSGIAYCGTAQPGPGVLKSTDGGVSWQAMASGLPLNTWVTALGVDPWTPSIVYLGSLGNGAFRSNNAAGSWSPVPVLFRADADSSFIAKSFLFDPANPAIAYAGSNGGSWKSVDGGTSWTQIGVDLPDSHAADSISTIAIEPSAPATLWATSNASYDGANCVWKSGDGGESWLPASGGIQGLPARALAIDPSAPSRAFLGTDTGVFRTEDGGATWSSMSDGLINPLVAALALAPGNPALLYAGTTGSSVFRLEVTNTSSTCFNNSTTLCLGGNRFRVQTSFKASPGSPNAAAQTFSLSGTTGAFWFYSSDNLELVVKVLDGRAINGKWWVFYAALSNVEYTITVTDTQTGAVKTYFNPQGQLASFADTGAF